MEGDFKMINDFADRNVRLEFAQTNLSPLFVCYNSFPDLSSSIDTQ